jgi:hypothetical protein
LKTSSLIDYYDEVALPALLMAQVDLRRGVLDEPRQRRIKETIEAVIEDLSDHLDEPLASTPEVAPSDAAPGSPPPSETASVETEPTNMARVNPRPERESQRPVLCIAGRSFLDEAAAVMLAQILGKHGIEAKVEPAGGGLGTGRISRLSTDGAQLVCLSYLDADLSPAGARFVVRRLRRRLDDIKILAVRAVLDKRASFAPRRKRISV